MVKVGQINSLRVMRETDSGYYLGSLDFNEEVFLPPSMALSKVEIGQDIDVFVYLDTSDRLIATEYKPNACVGEYALMTAIDITEFGAFFDWGIKKDLLVPINQQKIKVRHGEQYLVRVCLEQGTDKIFGTTKLGKYIQESEFDVAVGDRVDIVPVKQTDLGFRTVVNKKYIGMIYSNEIFKQVFLEEKLSGVVKKIREDGLLDLALQTQGVGNLYDAKDVVIDYLNNNNGESHLHDKSDPQEIRDILGMSKKTFKSAIGMLLKDKKILISKTGIKLSTK